MNDFPGSDMVLERSRSRGSERGSPKRITPPPKWPHGEASILQEKSGALGVALWQAARDVRLWSETAPSARRGLFHPGAERVLGSVITAVPQLASAVERLGIALRDPVGADAGAVAEAARDLARWAEESQLPQTALEFAEAAAFAEPHSSASASLAGRLASRPSEMNRAAAWYRRAIGLARGNYDAYVRAQLGYAEVMMRIGNLGTARIALRRASRVAVKYGRRGFAAQANHALLTIACEIGTYDEGAIAAMRALERYPVRHPRLPELALDFAKLLVRDHQFSASIPLLRRVAEIVQPSQRTPICGSLARSAGAVGDRGLFQLMSAAVVSAREPDPRALLDAALGAQSLWEWEAAERIAVEAREIASRQEDWQVATDAGTLLNNVRVRIGAEGEAAKGPTLAVQLAAGMFLRRLELHPGSGTDG